MTTLNYDIKKTFAEQGLRPSQVLDFWQPFEKNDPRFKESNADEAILSIEDWKKKWAPNLKLVPIRITSGSSYKEADKYRSLLEIAANQAIKQFELDKIPAERMDSGSARKQLRVKPGGDKISGKGVAIDLYISLRLKKPYINIWLSIVKKIVASSIVEFDAGRLDKPRGEWSGEKFKTLEEAKAYFFDLIQKAKAEGLLGNW